MNPGCYHRCDVIASMNDIRTGIVRNLAGIVDRAPGPCWIPQRLEEGRVRRTPKSFWVGTILGALVASAAVTAQNAGQFQIERRMNGKAILDLKDDDRALYAIG